jgi:hypothetical protein
MNPHLDIVPSPRQVLRFALLGMVLAFAPASSAFHLDRAPDPVSLARQSLAGYDSFVSQAIKD